MKRGLTFINLATVTLYADCKSDVYCGISTSALLAVPLSENNLYDSVVTGQLRGQFIWNLVTFQDSSH